MAQARTASRATPSSGSPAALPGPGSREAVVSNGTRIRGRITGEGSLVVEGQVEGDIALRGDVTVGEGGTVTSNVDAANVLVAGQLEGDVRASGQVRIGAGSRVRGTVQGQAIAIEEGAQFAGRIECEFELPPELEGREPVRAGRKH
jgi:cytoskeletal protein CcmA (bactofilin family)